MVPQKKKKKKKKKQVKVLKISIIDVPYCHYITKNKGMLTLERIFFNIIEMKVFYGKLYL
jgi:hypothetical protein